MFGNKAKQAELENTNNDLQSKIIQLQNALAKYKEKAAKDEASMSQLRLDMREVNNANMELVKGVETYKSSLNDLALENAAYKKKILEAESERDKANEQLKATRVLLEKERNSVLMDVYNSLRDKQKSKQVNNA